MLMECAWWGCLVGAGCLGGGCGRPAGIPGAGGVRLVGVEGLLAWLLVTAQDSGGEGFAADGAGSVDGEGLLAGGSGGDAAVVADAEGLRVVGVEDAGSTGLLGLGYLGRVTRRCVFDELW